MRSYIVWCTLALSLDAQDLVLQAPVDYQVVQRQTLKTGNIPVEFDLPAGVTADAVRVHLVAESKEVDTFARTLTVEGIFTGQHFKGRVMAPAGGWYPVTIICLQNGQRVASGKVAHVGVGEVFVFAGQSNSANHGAEKLKTETGQVSTIATDGKNWQLTQDPQPGASGNGGSFLPAFGDAMAKRFQVPIGLVSCGVGATSVREWLPAGAKFPHPPTILSRVSKEPDGTWTSKGTIYPGFLRRTMALGPQGFRAVLWHQGESDANQKDAARTLPGKLYTQYLQDLIKGHRQAVAWEAPWFIALVSYHGPSDRGSADLRAAQQALWQAQGPTWAGPDSDKLGPEARDGNGQGVHFSGPGLRLHADSWVNQVAPWLEQELKK